MVKGIQKAHESTKARTKNAVARAPLAPLTDRLVTDVPSRTCLFPPTPGKRRYDPFARLAYRFTPPSHRFVPSAARIPRQQS